jgi:two-component system sensor histidine kinase KdpD
MEHGHIYPPEQAKSALQHFFRSENLAQLREIALRRTAQEIDEQLDAYMRETVRAADVDEHVLVVVDDNPSARTLVRRGWRIAQGMKADLIVAYLRREVDERRRADLVKTLELAEDLNARVQPLDANPADEASALASFLQAEHINHIVLPYRPRSALQRLFGRSLSDQLMRTVRHLDVHLVDTA